MTYLAGKLLIATPSMGDPRFHRAVILVCAHDKNGAMGLVINHMLPTLNFYDLAKQLKLEQDIRIDLNTVHLPVMGGGPVECARGFLLHSTDFTKADTMRLDDTFGITGTVEALRDVVKGQGPQKMLFILGYAGWSEGQLDEELQENAWLVADSDPQIVFDTPLEDKWHMAIRKLGVDPARLSSFHGNA